MHSMRPQGATLMLPSWQDSTVGAAPFPAEPLPGDFCSVSWCKLTQHIHQPQPNQDKHCNKGEAHDTSSQVAEIPLPKVVCEVVAGDLKNQIGNSYKQKESEEIGDDLLERELTNWNVT